MKLRNFLSIGLTLIMAACSGNASEKIVTDGTDSAKTTKSHAGKEDHAKANEIVATDEGGFIRKTQRTELIIFGKVLECKPGYMVSVFQQQGKDILRALSNAGGVISGPMMFVYDAVPSPPGATKFFAGVPVTKEFHAEIGYSFRKLNAGDYYEMDCNAETGNTDKFHQKMMDQLKASGKSAGLPAYEILSESRNNEMTVVSKSKLIYPVK